MFGNPQHRYTKMLLDSVPQLHTKWNGDSSRVSESSSDDEPAAGGPALVEVEDGHFVAPETGR